jgi:CRISPR-associated exonuclease Cas4
MYTEDDLLPISALQHLRFCRRRCALVHLEQLWAENRFTAEGNLLHRRVHDERDSTEAGVRVARGLRLASLRLGLFGVADVVEFHPCDAAAPGDASNTDSPGRPFPVEYKRGKRKPEQTYRVQLCAQAVCLEEMLGVEVPRGALFFGKTRRRMTVEFDPALRQETERLADELHRLLDSGETPPPEPGAKCKSCSLHDLCMPRKLRGRSARGYVTRSIARILEEDALDGHGQSDKEQNTP